MEFQRPIVPFIKTRMGIPDDLYELEELKKHPVNEAYKNCLLPYMKQFFTYRAMLRKQYGDPTHPDIGRLLKPHRDQACKELGVDQIGFDKIFRDIEGCGDHVIDLEAVIANE